MQTYLAKHNLPKVHIPKDLNKPKWVGTEYFAELMRESRETLTTNMVQRLNENKPCVKYGTSTKGGRKILIDLNNIIYKFEDLNRVRATKFMIMFDSIYFELSRYLKDSQIAKLIYALSGNGSVSGWQMYLSEYQITMNDKALTFIKYGKMILCTKALVEHFQPKYEEELLGEIA